MNFIQNQTTWEEGEGDYFRERKGDFGDEIWEEFEEFVRESGLEEAVEAVEAEEVGGGGDNDEHNNDHYVDDDDDDDDEDEDDDDDDEWYSAYDQHSSISADWFTTACTEIVKEHCFKGLNKEIPYILGYAVSARDKEKVVDVTLEVDKGGQRNIVLGEIKRLRERIDRDLGKFREGWRIGRIDVRIRKKNRRVGR